MANPVPLLLAPRACSIAAVMISAGICVNSLVALRHAGFRVADVALLGELLQHVPQRCLGAERRLPVQAEFERELVGGVEADAPHVGRQPVTG